MKKKIFCLLFILVLPVMLFCGCADRVESKNTSVEHLFVEVDSFYFVDSYTYHVLVNKETRVMYLTQNQGGMIVMLNEDGTPMLWEGEL